MPSHPFLGESDPGRPSDIREYAEHQPVTIANLTGCGDLNGRLVVNAINEGGFNGVQVDLEDVLRWACANEREMVLRCLNQ
jgi:hypothetical protein